MEVALMNSATNIKDIVDPNEFDLADLAFRKHSRDILDSTGCLLLKGFLSLTPCAVFVRKRF